MVQSPEYPPEKGLGSYLIEIVLQFFSSLFPPLPFLAAPEVGSSATFGTYIRPR